jgi:DNA-binding CsgD family transcriptional regulator
MQMLAGDLGGVAMVTVEEFSRLVSGVYAAAVTPLHWEGAIRDIHRALGGTHAALLTTDGANRSTISGTLAIEAGKSYTEYYHQLDYVLAAVEKGPVGVVRTGSELTEPRKHREFHTDWARPYEGDDGLVIRLTGGARPTCFVVGAPRRSESFDTPERVKLMSGLVVHMQQALRTQDKLAGFAHRSADLAAALEAIRHGIIIVESGCLVINLNSAAEGILRAEDGLHLRSGRIAATNVHTERKLYCALRSVVTGDGSSVRSGRSFVCARPSGKRPYVIHMLPLHPSGTDETVGKATALVLIIDPEHEREPTAALLRRLYHLTKAEGDVALRTMHGADPKQISEELSVSVTTVRTHLQHIFDKTETHRQAELVYHLLALSP